MRKSFAIPALLALALSGGAALAQAPAAKAPVATTSYPAGVKVVDGHLASSVGRPLYTYDDDTMRGMSHCVGACARQWPPFIAAADATPQGDWTIISREDGKRQWVYKNKPLYYYLNDKPGAEPAGTAVSAWKLAK